MIAVSAIQKLPSKVQVKMQNPDFCTALIREFERYRYFDGADGGGSLIQIDSRTCCPFNLMNEVNISL